VSASGSDFILRAQIELLTANLGRCRDALSMPDVCEMLPGKVRERFIGELAAHERILADLSAQVGTGRRVDLLWEALEGQRHDVEPRMAEALALLSGVLVRRAKLDLGLCEIADALLDEFSAATYLAGERLTILAPQESYAQRTQIIHLRFPELTVWALALAAHEFGHLVAQDLLELRPDGSYEAPVATEIDDSEFPVAHARELFADVFATYVLGPAYPATAILLRFNPAEAGAPDERSTHPSDLKRAHVMIHALRSLSALRRGHRPYDQVGTMIEDAWRDAVRGAGGEPLVVADVAGDLDYLVDHVFLPLLRDKLAAARYSSWSAANRLARDLGAEGPAPEADAGLRCADVLNAAWIARLEHGRDRGDVDAIGVDAFELLKGIAIGQSQTPRIGETAR
jgi:hypothetical protein